MENAQPESFLLQLPAELIQNILSFLPAASLGLLASSCSLLHQHTLNELHWCAQVQQCIPGTRLSKAYPAESFRALYKSHHPFLFLPKHKIWFSDTAHTGKLLIARYSHSRQTIEAYALAAERGASRFEFWAWNKDVIIHSFEPNVQLDLNRPIIQITPDESWTRGRNIYAEDIPMFNTRGPGFPIGNGMSSVFMHTRPLPVAAIGPATQVWPPQTLPAMSRTRNSSGVSFRQVGHRPTKFSEISDSTFRIVNRVNYNTHLVGVRRVGEHVDTYATLPPESYTPTKAKPYRGIWVGDYSGHGCEFLAVLQPDIPQKLPDGALEAIEHNKRSVSPGSEASWRTALSSLENDDDSHSDMFEHSPTADDSLPAVDAKEVVSNRANKENMDIVEHTGQIMAIKLTGDPNVPRGEYTFIAPDISDNGLLRVAREEIFQDARIVRSVGHIAARGFREDGYIPSQLILVSHDTLAQYWEEFGHISFYKRVDIDSFLHAD
ncbi:hypothetical protein EJ08DRAFT_15368 [Tothia fuscella]|uniref:F-box domain-containing protein n=1 Tax=Tothia fuscella TaxID=1048955 RepID=A0A9P4P5K2_9PEZI|nr:hypothetical protein EJ08DRAFT_15368 [Tothia fuscella]